MIEGLIAAGEPIESSNIQRAVQWIVSKQNPNGGWGESYVACVNKSFPYDGTGQVSRIEIIYINLMIYCPLLESW